MRMRLYMDEDTMSGVLVRAIRVQSIEVTTATDADMVSKADENHLQYAAQNGLTLFSYNIRDYVPLHNSFLAQSLTHSGIILLEQKLRLPVGEQMRRLVQLANAFTAEDMKDQLIFLSRGSFITAG